jgi:putative Ca2+/H+ antiporter (TMEM165/GDT1 family)
MHTSPFFWSFTDSMEGCTVAFISTLLMVLVAEMGDKTQLIAMAFAAKYRWSQVLLGVLIGSLLNHGLAVTVGTYLGSWLPMNLFSLGAAVLFLVFGLLAVRPEKPEDEESVDRVRFGPVATVALSFFLGEMADKTQLTVLTLSIEYRTPLLVLLGAVGGMMAANAPGIFFGDYLLRKIPARWLKLGSAFLFIFFAGHTLYEGLGGGLWMLALAAMIVLGAGTGAYAIWRQAGRGPVRERAAA